MMSQRHAEYNAEVSKEERAAEFERLKEENKSLKTKLQSLQSSHNEAVKAVEFLKLRGQFILQIFEHHFGPGNEGDTVKDLRTLLDAKTKGKEV